MATGSGMGGVFNEQLARNTKRRTYIGPSQDLTSSLASGGAGHVLFSCKSKIAVEQIDLIYTATASAAATSLKIGTVADDDAFASSQSTDSSTAVGDHHTVTLNTTSRQSNVSPNKHAGLPILAADTAMVWTYTGVGSAGTVRPRITYFHLDD